MGFVELDVPENTNGEITVKYTGTRLARITWGISLISLIVFIIYNVILYVKYKKEKNGELKEYLLDKTKEEG